MNTIAPALASSKLLYLSSCGSGNAGFAVAAAQQGVPAVVGFRWGVEDDAAEIHARLFYRRLFKQRAIDTAFWNTRKAMRRIARSNNAWASGMLVMRPTN